MKSVAWRITVSKVERNSAISFAYDVYGAITNESARVHDADIVIRWKHTITSRKQDDRLGFSGPPSGKGEVLFPHSAEQYDVPKYVVASISALARLMVAAEKRKVQLPIDFFDPCGPKGQRDEVHCSPEGE